MKRPYETHMLCTPVPSGLVVMQDEAGQRYLATEVSKDDAEQVLAGAEVPVRFTINDRGEN